MQNNCAQLFKILLIFSKPALTKDYYYQEIKMQTNNNHNVHFLLTGLRTQTQSNAKSRRAENDIRLLKRAITGNVKSESSDLYL